ncbi:DUF948 domain-containing protein [Gracilibacillus sp. D59]|uniref:DUF948 domain-containing protein n=1 Tax=Gracilibacillus sp. D59 TaxID=3457434 RepID=UPI003FCD4FE3
MEILLYLAAIIAAVAFAILVIYLVKVLKETKRMMSHVADTLEGLEKQMEGITVETTALLNKTNKLAEDVNEKTAKLNTLVDGVKNIGDSVKDFTQSIRKVSQSVNRIADENKETTAEAIKWSTVVMELFKKNRKNKTKLEE